MKKEFVLTRGKLLLIILILLIISGTVIGYNIKNSGNAKIYYDYEETLVTLTRDYYDIFYLQEDKELKKGVEKKISMNKLIESGLLYETEPVATNCKGFVIISNKKESGEYKLEFNPYIKCGKKYTTGGYETY